MDSKTKIPIKNIYYMLCYAWNILPFDSERMCGKEKYDSTYNLMARILIKSVKLLLRRGFHREYITIEEPLSVIRGRMRIQETLRRQTQINQRIICNYDVLSSDVAFNQIIKAAINTLIRYDKLDKDLSNELIKLRHSFLNISDIYPTKQIFTSLNFNHNNKNYKLIINVCRLIFEGLVSNEEGDEIKFADFIRDEQMAKLYEKFVYNFFSFHLPKKDYSVRAPKISWDLEDTEEEDLTYLPEMKTDIVLINKISNTQLIIDTKFYSETLSQGYRGKGKKIHSKNLYQIYTYMGNSSFEGKIIGMLLYPTITTELNQKYPIKGKPIMIKTINLAAGWEDTEKRLLEIVALTAK